MILIKIKGFVPFLISLFVLILLQENVSAAGTVEINSIPIENVSQTSTQQPLTNEPIELNGPYEETNFYYTIYPDLVEGDYYAQFEIKKSKLLIEPSAITIKIDGEPIYSSSLAGVDESSHTMKVDLKGTALKEGAHTITAAFSGYIQEGICVPQDSTGNWITIQSNSFLNIGSFKNGSISNTLKYYPQNYLGSLEKNVMVIIPKSPSNDTLQGAHLLANYLSNQSIEDTVSMISEDKVEKISGNIVIVGGVDEFETNLIKEALQNDLSKVKAKSLYVSQLKLQKDNRSVAALLVLAERSEDISNKIEILTKAQYLKQLSGETIQINELPHPFEKEANSNEIKLSKLGLNDVLLDSTNTKTPVYYYYIPVDKQMIEQPYIELNIKRSDTINTKKAKNEIVELEKVDLIVNINGVPSSKAIQSLEEDKEGNLKIKIPFDNEIIQDNRLLTFQIEAKGLQTRNPCIATDQNKWIYIFDDSKIVLPTTKSKYDMYFSSFPFPFSNQDEEVIIVKPTTRISNKDLQYLLNILTTNSELPPLRIVSTSDVTEEQLKKGNVIFIGSIGEHHVLKSKEDKLVVGYKNSSPLLSNAGFLESEVEFYSFMQKNPWNEKYYIAVFDQLGDSNHYFSREFLSYLQSTRNIASIAVQTGPDTFFTNTLQLEQGAANNEEGKDEMGKSSTLIAWSIGFVLLNIVLITLIYIFSRRRKLNTRKNKKE